LLITFSSDEFEESVEEYMLVFLFFFLLLGDESGCYGLSGEVVNDLGWVLVGFIGLIVLVILLLEAGGLLLFLADGCLFCLWLSGIGVGLFGDLLVLALFLRLWFLGVLLLFNLWLGGVLWLNNCICDGFRFFNFVLSLLNGISGDGSGVFSLLDGGGGGLFGFILRVGVVGGLLGGLLLVTGSSLLFCLDNFFAGLFEACSSSSFSNIFHNSFNVIDSNGIGSSSIGIFGFLGLNLAILGGLSAWCGDYGLLLVFLILFYSLVCGFISTSFDLGILGDWIIIFVPRLVTVLTIGTVVVFIFILILIFVRNGFLDLNGSFEELVQDLVDLAVEDLTSDEWILATSIMAIVLVRHNGDVVDQHFELIVVEVLDEFIVVVFELLQAVVIVEKLVNCAFFVVQEILNRRTACASVVGPEVAA